jgi:prenyltransferase beta subunit
MEHPVADFHDELDAATKKPGLLGRPGSICDLRHSLFCLATAS